MSTVLQATSMKAEREGCRAESRLGAPLLHKHPKCFRYVYMLRIETDMESYYNGIAEDLKARRLNHNSGGVPHTAKNRPWQIKTAIDFTSEQKAHALERYPKTASGFAFSKRRL
jgi:putative endonuclease